MNWLDGKKTYITAAVGIIAAWVAAATGIGTTEQWTAGLITFLGLLGGFLRMGSKTDANKTAQVLASATLSKDAMIEVATGALKPSDVPAGKPVAVPGGTSTMKPVI